MVEWEVKKVEECTSFYNGIAHESIVSDTGNFILITSKSIATNLSEYRLVSEQLFPLYENDIVMVMSDVPNGRALAKCLLINKNNKYTLNQRICCFREHKIDARFLFYQLNRNKCFLAFNDGYSQTNLRKIDILKCEILIPPLTEQRRIAAVLSDTDALIAAMEKLIAKKRAIKQGAMQELLTGKRRLPEFSGKWVEKIDIFDFQKGSQYKALEMGKYPHYNGGQTNSNFSNDYNAQDKIIISEGGNSCGFVNYICGKFWAGGHCYVVDDDGFDKQYLFQLLKQYEPQIMALRVGSGLPNIQSKRLRELSIYYTTNFEEQTAIAQILSDMDAEIDVLTKKLNKIKQIKQGMMSELLTGRIRLPEKEDNDNGKN